MLLARWHQSTPGVRPGRTLLRSPPRRQPTLERRRLHARELKSTHVPNRYGRTSRNHCRTAEEPPARRHWTKVLWTPPAHVSKIDTLQTDTPHNSQRCSGQRGFRPRGATAAGAQGCLAPEVHDEYAVRWLS